jgi:hypothetical protein
VGVGVVRPVVAAVAVPAVGAAPTVLSEVSIIVSGVSEIRVGVTVGMFVVLPVAASSISVTISTIP